MSCWNGGTPSQGLDIEHNWCVWAEHWRRNGHSTKRDTIKLSSSMTMCGHMSQDRSRHTWITLKWEVLPQPPFSPDVASSYYNLFQYMAHSLAHQHFRSYEEVKKWIDTWIASKDASFFRDGIRQLPEKDGKK